MAAIAHSANAGSVTSLSIRGLTKYYGRIAVVDHIDVDVAEEEIVTLLGPSGCGKTTTLRMIAGLVRPDEGEVWSGPRRLSGDREFVPPENRGMGMVFQNYAVWPHKSVFENVAFGLRRKKASRSETETKVGAMLDLVDLPGLGNRSPSQLSGGQLQRVALARALVVEPDILLLDEPLSNLDAKLREKMRHEIKRIQERVGITFVYVTHDQAEALALSSRIVVMSKGRIHQVGPPRDVYAHPADEVVARFMGQVNVVEATVVAPRTADEGGMASFCGDLPVQMTIPSGRLTGDKITIAVRPEDITLTPASNGMSRESDTIGTVHESTFLGNLSECTVVMPDGLNLTVQVGPDADLSPNTKVIVAAKRGVYIGPA